MNVKMKPRELQYMIGGLVIGLLVGLLASASGLFGTASDNNDNGGNAVEVDPNRFYLVELSQAQEWLQEVNPELATQLQGDLLSIGEIGGPSLATAFDLSRYNPEAVDRVLLNLHNVLLQEEVVGQGDAFNTCLGIQQNPYEQTGAVYLYLEVPSNVAGEVPSDWQETSGQQEDGILLSTQCYGGTN
jgi:hypothetical protein